MITVYSTPTAPLALPSSASIRYQSRVASQWVPRTSQKMASTARVRSGSRKVPKPHAETKVCAHGGARDEAASDAASAADMAPKASKDPSGPASTSAISTTLRTEWLLNRNST